MKKAFTLAEVLITLGIIGVVAALTLPMLVGHYKKQDIETRLKKFYSTMNQAIMMAEVKYGDKIEWDYNHISGGNDNDGNLDWYNKYLSPYIQSVKVKTDDNNYVFVYFTDGSLVIMRRGGTTYNYFPYAKYYEKISSEMTIDKIFTSKDIYGKHCFLFAFMPKGDQAGWDYHKNKGIEPYRWHNGDSIDLFNGSYGCNKNSQKIYCTAVIQENNWQIPKDYPIKF